MLAHARNSPQIECCGLLAGSGGVIHRIFPTPNALDSAVAYQIAPLELFRALRRMRADGLDHLGMYHSHPHSENIPSPTDVQQAYYPDQPYFIVAPWPGAPRPVRAFMIRQGIVEEAELQSPE